MKRNALWMALLLAPLGVLAAQGAHAANSDKSGTMNCTMDFSLAGWSVIYQTASGTGKVTCDNGQTMNVKISAKGGGLTVGKYKLVDGRGNFSDVVSIKNVLGTYATANAHVGVVGSAHAAAMTKGNVSLALTGTGQGWDIGAGFSGFTISKRK